MIGVILMIIGAVAVVLSLAFWSTWGGFHHLREVDDDGTTRRVVDDYR